ncbi:RGPR-related, putative isoform 1 [Hibiscus syriacus]|uniref:RGPR-related, putative isoform 1 n=1 Tax=Hibiscus syriacus TaxID=106335 RepID=A0A6A3B6D9_HIBSY|nr:zinc finger protein ZAT9-like [Hibiscus syriacus]KAE8710845.1 RGPR-related, putative isoform 1 [Hibiscus syriacus]
MATMEKHKCKLCTRTFSNGRALGGHMKGHLSNHPLSPKTTPHQLSNRTDSASSSSGEEQEKSKETVLQHKSLGYGLRENPKKSLRFADPEFSFAPDSGSVVQDRESETESRNPTRRRSKRKSKVGTANNATPDEIKKPKLSISPSLIDSPPTEPEPVSSVSDTSPEEDVAMCLMLLSRDAWSRKNVERKSQKSLVDIELSNKKSELSKKKKHRCGRCNKAFGSYDTLDEHKRVCSETKKTAAVAVVIGSDSKRFECPFCYRVFGSGQALGGHKRSHLIASASSSNNSAAAAENYSKFDNNLIDLNLPAPPEDDEFSVVSDA